MKVGLAVAAMACGLLLLRTLVSMATSAEWLSVRRILVTGNVQVASGEVHTLLEGLMGASLLTADIETSRRRLLASPWVADASIRRVFPDAVAVKVAEKKAVGIGRIDGALYLIDSRGARIDAHGPNYAGFNLPIVDNLAVGRPGQFTVDPHKAALVSRLFTSLARRPDLAALVSQIDVANPNDVVLVLKGDRARVHLGRDRFTERLQTYIETAERLREGRPDIDSVDMRYVDGPRGERVFVTFMPDGRRAPRGAT
jgi:cell division protein FtsQ